MSEKPIEKDAMRTAAEEKLARTFALNQIPPPTEELLHELQVQKIELEMQNEELWLAQSVLNYSTKSHHSAPACGRWVVSTER